MNLRSSNRGFTLLELLVVIIVISIFFSLAVVSFSSSGSDKQIEQEAKRFKALIRLAKEKTIFENVDLGLFFYREGYGFVIADRVEDPLDPDKKITRYFNAASELEDNTFRIRTLPKDIRLSLSVNNAEVFLPAEWPEEDDKLIPQTMLLSSGESDPFKLTINYNDQVKQTLTVNELGKTTLAAPVYDN